MSAHKIVNLRHQAAYGQNNFYPLDETGRQLLELKRLLSPIKDKSKVKCFRSAELELLKGLGFGFNVVKSVELESILSKKKK